MKANIKATPGPLLPSGGHPRDTVENIQQPASNATRQLEKPRVRRKARADQATLLEMGPNALPVSDYPLKEGPVAANRLDRRERLRSGG